MCWTFSRLLLRHGANVDAQTKNGDTPAHRAVYRKHNDTLALLLDNWPDPTITNNKGKNLSQSAQAIANTEAERLLNG